MMFLIVHEGGQHLDAESITSKSFWNESISLKYQPDLDTSGRKLAEWRIHRNVKVPDTRVMWVLLAPQTHPDPRRGWTVTSVDPSTGERMTSSMISKNSLFCDILSLTDEKT